MTHRREALAWLITGAAAFTAAGPWLGEGRGRWSAAVRALMPWSALSAGPLAVGAALTRRRRLAAAAGAVALAGTAMSAPLVRRRPQPPVDRRTGPITVVHGNLLYINDRVADVGPALARLGADVVTFSELTPSHAAHLRRSALAAAYPYRIERAARVASGTGLWSRYPVTERPTTGTRHHTVVADVHAPAGTVRVIVVHTQSPITHHEQWRADLDHLAALAPDVPAVMTGDFNASWWHPQFRAVLAAGWRDAHLEVGRGLSCSWPTDRWHAAFRLHPPFVRLDHALVDDGLAVLDVVDLDIPGSDHLGLMVSVQRARRAAP